MDEQGGFRHYRSTGPSDLHHPRDKIWIPRGEENSCVGGSGKAFDRVWKDGLLLKLKNANTSHNIFKWIQSYLTGRKARVNTRDQD